MACESQTHVGDKNVDFVITITEDCAAIDISGATSKVIYFTKPSGEVLTKTASFVTDGTDGLIHYATIAGDLNESGVWKIQANVELGSGSSYSSLIKTFKVFCNLV
jgi:hypothetical protein